MTSIVPMVTSRGRRSPRQGRRPTVSVNNWAITWNHDVDSLWPAYRWTHPDGRTVMSFPTPRKWYFAPLYPWMIYKSIRAILEQRAIMPDRPLHA